MPSDEDVIIRAGSVQAMTGLTQQACEALLPPVAHAVGAYVQARPLDGQPRTSRRYTTDDHGP